MPASTEAALPYHEPDIITILVLVSFVLLLNFVNHLVNHVLYCGLLAQILLGIAWGTPGGKWLGHDLEQAIVDLGYLGLILIVYEGGLLTSFKALKDNLLLSIGVATTGICVPIALSYALLSLVGATALQAFAAGAALCSTSLGTTFSVLSASGLSTTRMGVVLTSAAMMDDVVGLVMVQVISNLGIATSHFSVVTVLRPILVSLGLVLVMLLAARFVAMPVTIWFNELRTSQPEGKLGRLLSSRVLPLGVHIAVLIGALTAAIYAGTSGLFAAYLAGATITWWDDHVPHPLCPPVVSAPPAEILSSGRGSGHAHESSGTMATSQSAIQGQQKTRSTGADVFEQVLAQPLRRILSPFFFASIGFSIPVSRMFAADTVWKGIVYTTLMFVGKLVCGLWLVRFSGLAGTLRMPRPKYLGSPLSHSTAAVSSAAPNRNEASPPGPAETSESVPDPNDASKEGVSPQQNDASPTSKSQDNKVLNEKQKTLQASPVKPLSLYPGCVLGCAMVARGEIGFLISAIAESNGIYGDEPNGPIFLVVTWAIMLCTFIGPLLVGALVKRIQHLDNHSGGARSEVLGVWGVT
ncbi:uncharacterized protein HMPREF1541_02393 [Cyphellophora europaea CBS 101466]|uniref:Cation/H+ exchanger transmembrane domain-containing protein n=1 Tax=Cyphellophora europaea (strain CBS 101466) TaxID=1220924 RepID=W2S5K6_CYPE1|nr:uncharacterized protein HMPREF1541_02393 [Cyphellophora europaea CBS 101466]ETN43234.1 hypothetical protein HMPREF1541_02393 [Cyphellophora europaea CBS 101466]